MVYSRLVTALPVGTYPLSNTLGGFLGFSFIFVLGLYTLGQSRRTNGGNGNIFFRYRHEIIFGVLTLMLLLGFVLAKSRSGFVAVGFGFVLLSFLMARRRLNKSVKRFLFIVTIILVVGIAAVSMTSGKDLISGAKKSFGFRLEYWTATMGMIYDYPVWGCGTGNFKHTYTHYKLPVSSEEISDPHNFVVELASNCGIPALLIFVLAVVLICYRIQDKTADISDKKTSDNFKQHHPPQQPPQQQQSRRLFSDSSSYFIGGLFGCYFAFFLSLYSESPISIGSLVAATVIFLLFCLIDICCFERIPSVVILISLFVLFVHLSASSGISASNTVILIWLFLSILANRRTTIEVTQLQMKLRYVISVMFIFFVLFINFFGYRPVVNSSEILYSLESSDDVGDQVLVLSAAAAADPYSAFIQERLARLAMLCHLREPSNPKWYMIVEAAQAKAMRLAPRSGMIRYSCAEMRAEAGRRLKDVRLAESSIDIYNEAVKYYPNNAMIRTALAVILYQLNKKSEAATQAEIAIKLDDQMKHIESKIKPDKREALLKYIEEAKKL
ncbi:MAG: O-antigen ligase family protein [Planctomycetaceae bacterium]|nr:O-antigen ligase family protein [Planctomycetaceae bacterium]